MTERVKRTIGFIGGIIYSVLLFFFVAMGTGGGHGNFILPELYFNVFFFGLFYPVLGCLMVDLRRGSVRIVFGALLAIEFLMIAVYFWRRLSENMDATELRKWIGDPDFLVNNAIGIGVLFGGPILVSIVIFFFSIISTRELRATQRQFGSKLS